MVETRYFCEVQKSLKDLNVNSRKCNLRRNKGKKNNSGRVEYIAQNLDGILG
jgi:hypothetical protein